MKAVTWHGKRDVRVETVDDPVIEQPTDAIISVTSSGLCGSDLHLYEVLGPFMHEGDVLGHEPIGTVVETGAAISRLSVGDRVVIPFQVSCGNCWMCTHGLHSQCETTQVREFGTGAQLFGYSRLYGSLPGAQAELLRVPHADFGAITVPPEPPDDRYLYLSDVLPTAWQAVEYANLSAGDCVAVLGLGPIGSMAARIALARGHRVIAFDPVPSRVARAREWGVEAVEYGAFDAAEVVRDLTGGRGADGVVEAVGMEAHGAPAAKLAQSVVDLLPKAMARASMTHVGVDRLDALYAAIDMVRRGGTISIVGVYGGQTDPLPMMTMFDKQVSLRMGQANVRRWVDDLLPFLQDESDPLGVDDFATHRLTLDDAPHAYALFQQKDDDVLKVVFTP